MANENRPNQEAEDMQRNRQEDQLPGQNRPGQQQDQRRDPGRAGQNQQDEEQERKRA